jgi:hypothetical protein
MPLAANRAEARLGGKSGAEARERDRSQQARLSGDIFPVVFLDGLLSLPSPCLSRRRNTEIASVRV